MMNCDIFCLFLVVILHSSEGALSPVQCGLNQHRGCATSCPQQCPTPYINLIACLPPKKCELSCLCNSGYIKNKETGVCFSENYCPSWGDQYAVWSACGAACQPTCQDKISKRCSKICVPGYVCDDGRVRNGTQGACVLPAECHNSKTT